MQFALVCSLHMNTTRKNHSDGVHHTCWKGTDFWPLSSSLQRIASAKMLGSVVKMVCGRMLQQMGACCNRCMVTGCLP